MVRRVYGRTQPANQGRVDTEGSVMAETTAPVVTASLSKREGKTRGKNPRPIEYEAFDLEKPETLPTSLQQFMSVTGVKEEKEVLALLIDGFNQNQYAAASDEIGEFINDAWDKDTQAQFRLAVRNTSKLTGQSIEETVAFMKPAIEKGWAAKQEAKKAAGEAVPA